MHLPLIIVVEKIHFLINISLNVFFLLQKVTFKMEIILTPQMHPQLYGGWKTSF